jgi:cytochrome bd ubiquinol oxidase subunit I
MTDLLAARSQMAISLAFHIIFAVAGIGMPALMVIAEWRWRRTGDALYLDLAKRWAKGTAILFAVGAVSGTVLSFELGLLWPQFMEWAGPIIGMPFSLEGFMFFTEAIFLGIYLYGWDRISPSAHLGAGIMVAVSGALSGIFVVIANAWMNAPNGFELVDGTPVNIDPIAVLGNDAMFTQTLHMTLAAYVSCAMAVAGIHAWFVRKDPGNAFHKRALTVALIVGVPASLLQPLSGDLSARHVYDAQPAKFAAMEGHLRTEAGAPFVIGGIPNLQTMELDYAIEVPKALSLMMHLDPNAVIPGIDAIPEDERPPVAVVHIAFQVMVALGVYLMLVSLAVLWYRWRGRDLATVPWLLKALVVGTPFGMIAVEAGWVVTEVGRQPWIIHGVMRTADAVTPVPGLVVPMVGFTLLYVFLGVVVVYLLRRQILRSPGGEEEGFVTREFRVPGAVPRPGAASTGD